MEVIQALRRLVRAGEVLPARAEAAIEDLAVFLLLRHPHVDLLGRTWELRDNVTDDAMYVALAEALDAPLVTCDSPLGATPGHAARVEVIR